MVNNFIKQVWEMKWSLLLLLFLCVLCFYVFFLQNQDSILTKRELTVNAFDKHIWIGSIKIDVDPPANSDWIKDLFLGLAVAFLSTIFTVVVVNMYIASKSEAEKERIRNVSLRTLEREILKVVELYSNIDKAISSRIPEKIEYTVSNYLSSIDMEKISQLNVLNEAPIRIGIDLEDDNYGRVSWAFYINWVMDGFCQSLEKFLDRYSIFLDDKTIELCEKLCDKSITGHLKSSPAMLGQVAWFTITNEEFENGAILKNYLSLLSKLSELVGEANNNDFSYTLNWSEGVTPKLGSELGN